MQRTRIAALMLLGGLMTALSTNSVLAQGRGSAQGQGQTQGQSHGGPQNSARETGQRQAPPQQNVQGKEIRNTLRDRDIYGRELMSAEERREYRDRVNAAATDKEWAQAREQHMDEIRARAAAQGHPLDPPVYGQHMMTAREREAYVKRVQSATSDAERARIQAEHRDMIQQRATQLGIGVPSD